MSYYVTIPQRYRHEPHPCGEYQPDDLILIEADSEPEARSLVSRHLKHFWAFIYTDDTVRMEYHSNGVTHIIHRDGSLETVRNY